MTSDREDGLIGGVEKRDIVIVPYDPEWPQRYQEQAEIIGEAVGAAALLIEHIGSTSVPGLSAKPIVDILLVVEDAAEESTYLTAMESAGYELRVREPDFHEHRMFRTPRKDVHIHVYSKGCVEVGRHLLFRDRLRGHEDDRRAYESMKLKLAEGSWPDMNAYADAKSSVIERIITAAMADGQPAD